MYLTKMRDNRNYPTFLLIYKLCSLCVLLNKFVSLLSPPKILNRFLKSLVFWNLHEIPHVWIKKKYGEIRIPVKSGF